MRNGLYSIHTRMVDMPGKGAGVFVLHDGQMLGGNGLLWLAGSYTFDARGRWKGELITEAYAFIPAPGSINEAGHRLNRIICLTLVNGRPMRRREAKRIRAARMQQRSRAGDMAT